MFRNIALSAIDSDGKNQSLVQHNLTLGLIK